MIRADLQPNVPCFNCVELKRPDRDRARIKERGGKLAQRLWTSKIFVK
ncbi:hypothetical protein D1AOALGA4SA_10425 [Olavius algarvensis Delta 1 endosymbiont]|nr:hypothetical protein D1AOALGA4SA_10425 [Olavius algarvensis Delta 1 endosymbiont]